MNLADHQTFTLAYIECALWSEAIGEYFAAEWEAKTGEVFAADVSLESFGFSFGHLDSSARADCDTACESFIRANAADLADLDPEQAGHDFWLTRNRHGAGFWDRGLGEVGERLSESARAWGESDLYVGDDGRLYV